MAMILLPQYVIGQLAVYGDMMSQSLTCDFPFIMIEKIQDQPYNSGKDPIGKELNTKVTGTESNGKTLTKIY